MSTEMLSYLLVQDAWSGQRLRRVLGKSESAKTVPRRTGARTVPSILGILIQPGPGNTPQSQFETCAVKRLRLGGEDGREIRLREVCQAEFFVDPAP